jgi:superfamily II DNA or RNA helicase
MRSAARAFRTGDLVRIRSERWRVTAWVPYEGAAFVDVAGADGGNRGSRARFLLPFEPVQPVPLVTTPRSVRPTEWRRVARSLLAEATPSWSALRTPVRADMTIAAFQLEPALAVLGGACRVLIADEVGLGKTVQAGLIIAEVLARDPDARAIVVCPAGLREQWHDELRRRFALTPAILDAPALAIRAGACEVTVNPWATERLVLASVDYVKRPEVMRALEPLIWDVAVFDEAHGLGTTSDRSSAAALIGGRSRRVVLLTATPHSGDNEAYRRMCGVGELDDGPLLVFRRTRGDAGIRGRRRSIRLRVAPSPLERALYRELTSYAGRVTRAGNGAGAALAMSVLARRAVSSAASLARSLERRMELLEAGAGAGQLALPFLEPTLTDEAPDVVLAAPGLLDAAEELRVLARLRGAALRASLAERKVAVLVRLLRRCDEPAIVFTEYRDTLLHLSERVPFQPVLLHGGLSPRERRAATRAFTEGNAPLLLATDAASEGLNLHARCRLVINLELPWTPVRLEQRVGRVDRIGQQRTVHAVTLVGTAPGEASNAARFSSRADRARDAVVGASTPGAMSAQAVAEAARLVKARALLPHAADAVDARPISCRLERPVIRTADRLSAWAIALVDGRGRVLWERVFGTAGADVETATDGTDVVAQELRPALDALLAREAAILTATRQRHARLAATLLQPGLFDMRSARAAAAQAQLLEELVARSSAYMRLLEAARSPRGEQPRLLFTVWWR